jgi:photosystem II stability/assembly factor-like uncharacterized protein
MIRWPCCGLGRIAAVAVAVTVALAAAGCGGPGAGPDSEPVTPETATSQSHSAPAQVQTRSPVWIDTLQMVSTTVGWALLWPSNPSRSTALAVARTTDGGRTWTTVTPPAAVPALVTGQALLEAATAERAWFTVTAGSNPARPTRTHVFGTTDGGQSWRQSPAVGGAADPVAIYFADPHRGWLLDSLGAAMNQNPVLLYRSTDGGMHWELLARSPQLAGDPAASSGLPVACGKNGLAFASARAGWITSFCPVGTDGVLTSTDGGAHWTTVSLPALGQQCQSGCDIPAPELVGGSVFLIVGSYPASACLLVSADAGRTWRVSLMPAGAGPYPRVRFFTADDAIAVAAGPQGRIGRNIYLTGDGGLTWTAVRQGRHFGGNWTDFDFVSLRAGFSWTYPGAGPVSALRLFRTSDSGRTWTSFGPRLG